MDRSTINNKMNRYLATEGKIGLRLRIGRGGGYY